MKLDAPALRYVHTPEGIPLPFEIASTADRVMAFAVDVAIIHLGVASLLLFLLITVGSSALRGYALSLGVLASFIIRNFYFTFFEIRWWGRTPGKRALALRTIARDGGTLTGEAVLARNLTRDLEVFLPVTALLMPEALLPGLPGWASLVSTTWLFVFACLPLMNRDHLRMGDLVGGTLVVRMPGTNLLIDLVDVRDTSRRRRGPAQETPSISFTTEQLEHYGIKELQVLESVLRRDPDSETVKMLEEVAVRVKRRIGWPDGAPPIDTKEFLSEFYKAQRAHLEHKLLFGVRQEHKKEKSESS